MRVYALARKAPTYQPRTKTGGGVQYAAEEITANFFASENIPLMKSLESKNDDPDLELFSLFVVTHRQKSKEE